MITSLRLIGAVVRVAVLLMGRPSRGHMLTVSHLASRLPLSTHHTAFLHPYTDSAGVVRVNQCTTTSTTTTALSTVETLELNIQSSFPLNEERAFACHQGSNSKKIISKRHLYTRWRSNPRT